MILSKVKKIINIFIINQILKFILVFILNIFFINLSLKCILINGPAVIWPASGIGIGFMILFKKKDWIAVSLAIFSSLVLLDYIVGLPLQLCFIYGVVVVIEALLASFLLTLFFKKINFKKLSEIIGFIFIVVIFSNFITSWLGVFANFLQGRKNIFENWYTWFIADGAGMLLVTPLIITISNIKFKKIFLNLKTLEFIIVAIIFTVICISIFNVNLKTMFFLISLPCLIIPFLLYASIRFNIFGAIFFNIIVYIIFIFYTVNELGPFNIKGYSQNITGLLLQGFLIICALISYVISAIINEKNLLNRQLLEEKLLLKKIAANIPNSYLLILEKNFRVGFISGKKLEKENFNSKNIKNHNLKNIFNKHTSFIKQNYLKTFRGKETSFEIFIDNQWQLHKAVPLYNENNKINKILVVIENITKNKKKEEQIKISLKEKETLLKEIHHRVKNNLSIINSLLGFQANKFENNKIITEIIQESRNRIFSMAMVHERLYKSKNFSEIAFDEHIKILTNEYIHIYKFNNKIKTQFELEKVNLTIEKAIPCSLILNELFSNIFKYAFPNNSEGKIYISLKKYNKKEYLLIIKDNGIGLPEEFNIKNMNTLGLQIVQDLIKQIDGTLSINKKDWTEFKIIFPIK